MALDSRVVTRFAGLGIFEGTDERRRAALAGGHGLGEFSMALWIRVPRGAGGCVESKYDLAENATWYFGGCPLLNGIHAKTAPPRWKKEWRQRRLCCAIDPETDVQSPGGLDSSAKKARESAKAMLFRGPRSDFGLSLAPDGRSLLFGVGHRDFSLEPGRPVARPVRDATLRVTLQENLKDGRWHFLVATRAQRENDFLHEEEGVLDVFADDKLTVYVDNRKSSQQSLTATGGRDGKRTAAAARYASLNGSKQWPSPHELHDAAHFVALGQLFTGCLYDVQLHRRALSLRDISALWSRGPPPSAATKLCDASATEAGKEKKPPSHNLLLLQDKNEISFGDDKDLLEKRPIPLYFLAHTDNGSVAMRDDFIASIDDPRIEPREVTVEALQTNQRMRYGPKGELIRRALEENPEDSVVIVSDIDIRFFRPIVDVVHLYATLRDVDVVFQRDEDFSLQANLGFMALRCNDRVRSFFKIVAGMAQRYATNQVASQDTVKGGDQKIVNVALRAPQRLPMLPPIKWGLFPTELQTRSIDQQRGMLYKHDANLLCYHVNDFGSDKNSPDKARQTKVDLLTRATRRHIDARRFYTHSSFDLPSSSSV